jgi:ubiquinone/menaquinone biosynthesis C-methylase UbiE
MKRLLYWLLGLIAAVVAVSLVWRWASRHYQLPCPSLLAGLLDNPVMDRIAGTRRTLDYIGLRPGERGLDVGAGPGRLTLPAARRVGPEGAVVALDIQPEMLTYVQHHAAREGLSNISFRLADISSNRNLPETNSFDRAWLVTVLGEIPDRLAALRNLHQLLKAGGVLSITEIMGDPHYQRRQNVLDLAQEAGFTPTEFWGSPLSYTQNFVKR